MYLLAEYMNENLLWKMYESKPHLANKLRYFPTVVVFNILKRGLWAPYLGFEVRTERSTECFDIRTVEIGSEGEAGQRSQGSGCFQPNISFEGLLSSTDLSISTTVEPKFAG